MTFNDFKGTQGQTLCSLEWLLLHHQAKERFRRNIANRLCLFPGMSVIDLGCGPGLWTNLIAEQVAPTGFVLGVDLDRKLIDYAKEKADEVNSTKLKFEIGDFKNLEKYKHKFDAAFSANVFTYFKDPISLLREFKKCVVPNGTVICRHFDNTFWLAFPIDPELTSQIFNWVCKAGNIDTDGRYFNNSFGQSLHDIFFKAGLSNIRTESESIDLCGPLSRAGKDYLMHTAQWSAEIARSVGDSEIIEEWLSYFDPTNESFVLEKEECLFTFIEYTVTGTVQK